MPSSAERGRVNRRDVLKGLPVAGALALAGCSSVLGPDGTVLGKIEVVNSSFVSNRIRLTVQRDSETLVEREISLAAIDADEGDAVKVFGPAWSERQGQYTIRAIHVDDDGERASAAWEYTFTGEDYTGRRNP